MQFFEMHLQYIFHAIDLNSTNHMYKNVSITNNLCLQHEEKNFHTAWILTCEINTQFLKPSLAKGYKWKVLQCNNKRIYGTSSNKYFLSWLQSLSRKFTPFAHSHKFNSTWHMARCKKTYTIFPHINKTIRCSFLKTKAIFLQGFFLVHTKYNNSWIKGKWTKH